MAKDQTRYCQEIYNKWKTLEKEIDLNNLALITGGGHSGFSGGGGFGGGGGGSW